MSKMIALALFVGGILAFILGVATVGPGRSGAPARMASSAIDSPLLLIAGSGLAALAGAIGLARCFKGYSRAFRSSTDDMV